MATFSRKGVLSVVSISLLALLVSGCSTLNTFSDSSTATSPLPTISGIVHGGIQPISGATVQLYATNTTTSKGASTALLTHLPVTDSNGKFTITDSNYCPAPTSLVYLVATGGNPGLTPTPGATIDNTDIALMALLGTCSTLSSATTITVNELTTVAAVEAVAPFMADSTHIGADASNPNGMAGAFAGATSLINFSTGSFTPPASGITQPTAVYNTLANILTACVNTSGGTNGDTSACGKLLSNAGSGTSTNTIAATLSMVQMPWQNVTTLFGLSLAVSPFQQALSKTPADLSSSSATTLSVVAANETPALIIDTAQHVWVYIAPNQVVPANTTAAATPGLAFIYDNNGKLLTNIQQGSGGSSVVFWGGADPSGDVWAASLNGTLSKFNASGAPLSPSTGFPFLYTLPSTIDYEPGIGTLGTVMSIDPSGNLWGIGNGGNSGCFTEFSNTGTVITPLGNFCAKAGNSLIVEAAADGSGNVWFLGDNSISKVSSSGAFLGSGVNSNGCFYFNGGTNSTNYANTTADLYYDRFHDQLWGIGESSVGLLTASGDSVFCKTNGSTLPLSYSSVTGNNITALQLSIFSATVDGSGNLWFITSGSLTTGSVSSLSQTPISTLNALDPNGNLITPFNPAAGVYGLRPSGLTFGESIAVDANGNIWIGDGGAQKLLKVPGLATPKSYQ